jgi:hypothetical protein
MRGRSSRVFGSLALLFVSMPAWADYDAKAPDAGTWIPDGVSDRKSDPATWKVITPDVYRPEDVMLPADYRTPLSLCFDEPLPARPMKEGRRIAHVWILIKEDGAVERVLNLRNRVWVEGDEAQLRVWNEHPFVSPRRSGQPAKCWTHVTIVSSH